MSTITIGNDSVPAPIAWELIYYQEFLASTDRNGVHVPLSLIVVPILLESRSILCLAESKDARSHWKKAGYISQRVRTGLTVGGGEDAQVDWKFVRLSQMQLIVFPIWKGYYQLVFDPAIHLKSIQISIWISSI